MEMISKEPNISLMFTPSNTPEFNPIEQSFQVIKQRIKDIEFKNKDELTLKVAEVFFNLETKNFYAFYRKVLNNILKFWFSLDRSKYILGEEENVDPENSL